MHFGVKNSPKKLQRVMDNILKPYFDWLIVYTDETSFFSDTINKHFKHLRKYLQVVKDVGLLISKRKMELFKTSINFFGHAISNG